MALVITSVGFHKIPKIYQEFVFFVFPVLVEQVRFFSQVLKSAKEIKYLVEHVCSDAFAIILLNALYVTYCLANLSLDHIFKKFIILLFSKNLVNVDYGCFLFGYSFPLRLAKLCGRILYLASFLIPRLVSCLRSSLTFIPMYRYVL